MWRNSRRHVRFAAQSFPAHLGYVATHLARHHGFRRTLVSEKAVPCGGIDHGRY
jgi:hypothetical protein